MRVILRQLAERMAPRIAGLGLAPLSQQGAQADEPERPFVPETLAKLSSSAYLDDVFKLCRTTTDGDFARAECAKLAPTVGLRLSSEKPGKCQLLDGEILQAERECVEVLGAHFGHPDAIEIFSCVARSPRWRGRCNASGGGTGPGTRTARSRCYGFASYRPCHMWHGAKCHPPHGPRWKHLQRW